MTKFESWTKEVNFKNGEFNEERHEEISDKLFKMAEVLMHEGDEIDDYIIQSTGNFIMLLSGIMNSAEDMKTVADLLAMFSAKKVLDGQITGGGLPNMDTMEDMFKKMRDEINDREDNRNEDDEE